MQAAETSFGQWYKQSNKCWQWICSKKKRIHRIMKELLTWFHANCFVINFKKTKAMPFHTWQNKSLLKPQITFNKMYIKCK